ncbi:hypothetical protein [Amorphus sp. 3PC139-8]|uniref:hypothetical protein n=1 Tax=Amorphus sp. 3PC139-8 TaxID=2735676 RepID=UPI00345DDBA3
MLKIIVLATALVSASAGAALAQSAALSEDIRAACKSDAERLCSDVEPIAVPACLQEHGDEVSKGCRDMMNAGELDQEYGND